MARFTAGAIDWNVQLTVGMLTRIRRECGLNLANVVVDAEQFLDVISAAPESLVGSLWIVCEKQATAAGLTPENFAELFDGDALDRAVTALLEASLDFFPRARGRDALRAGMPRAWAKIERDVNARIAEQFDSMFSITAGNSPELSGSTPPTGPIGSSSTWPTGPSEPRGPTPPR
jgi:hypothetical protein